MIHISPTYSNTYRHMSTMPTTPGSLLSSTDTPLTPHTPLATGQAHGDFNVKPYNNINIA